MIRSAGLFVAMCAMPAMASLYTDPVGDIATGNSNLDITQVEVTDNGTDLVVQLTVDALDGDWGKYMLFMDGWAGGSGDNDNPWGRDVSGLSGMDIFVGGWADGGGGADAFGYVGGGWVGLPPVSAWIDWGNNTIQWTLHDFVADLSGTVSGFDFEVATTGGGWGDPAIDLLGGEGTQPGWGGGSTSTDRMHYDFSTVPAPGVLALLGLAGLAGCRRRH